MSGPKRADVRAALDVAARSRQRCANVVAKTVDNVVQALMTEAAATADEADRAARAARDSLRRLETDARTDAADVVRAAEARAQVGDGAVAGARAALDAARGCVEQARAQEAKARAAHDAAEREYQAAREAVRGGSEHYMHAEMAQAQRAQAQFDAAAREMEKATSARSEAERLAREALRAAHEARTLASAVGNEARGAAEAARKVAREAAEARSRVAALEAALAHVDREMIAAWGPSGAVAAAEAALAAARGQLAAKRFEAAGQGAGAAADALLAAHEAAAEAQTAHERRHQIGEAVMDALTELGFDVSWEDGTRDQPLRISGQTPDDRGRGDFDIAIALDGDVDFHVETPEGDTTCVAAIQGLEKRLEAQGIAWTTTDWGHAEGAAPRAGASQTTTLKQQQKIQRKS